MAIFDERATALPEPDLRGIRGNSSTKISKAPLASTALEGLTNTLGVAIQTDATAATTQYRKDVQSLSDAETQATLGQRDQLNQLISELPDELDKKNVGSVVSKLDSIHNARNMGTAEFDLRRESMLRAEIDRRPHLADTFRSINNTYTGTLSSRSSAASAQQTAQEKGLNAFVQEANKYGRSLETHLALQQRETENALTASGQIQTLPEARRVLGANLLFENEELSKSIIADAQQQGSIPGAFQEEVQSAKIGMWVQAQQQNVLEWLAEKGYQGEQYNSLRTNAFDSIQASATQANNTVRLAATGQMDRIREEQEMKARMGLEAYGKGFTSTQNWIEAGIKEGDVSTAYERIGLAQRMMRQQATSFEHLSETLSGASVQGSAAAGLTPETASDMITLLNISLNDWYSRGGATQTKEDFQLFKKEFAAAYLVNDFITLSTNPEPGIAESIKGLATDVLDGIGKARETWGVVNDAVDHEYLDLVDNAMFNSKVMNSIASSPEHRATTEQSLDNAYARLSAVMKQSPDFVLIPGEEPEPFSRRATIGTLTSKREALQFRIQQRETGSAESSMAFDPLTGPTTGFPETRKPVTSEMQFLLRELNTYGSIVGVWNVDKIQNIVRDLQETPVADSEALAKEIDYTDADEARLQELLSKQGAK